jgi:hypothetical protein
VPLRTCILDPNQCADMARCTRSCPWLSVSASLPAVIPPVPSCVVASVGTLVAWPFASSQMSPASCICSADWIGRLMI